MDKGSGLKVALGADHGGYQLKEEIKEFLSLRGIMVEDFGTFSAESVDYPDFAWKVAKAVSDGKFPMGILVCTTGIGVSIVANKVKGIRAALCSEPLSAQLARLHNHANVLCLGGKIIGSKLALKIVETWLETGFSSEERHVRRVNRIGELEGK
ncbi:MAG: ribose 5-phosphate isomerase B [Caldisericota bacterium]|jgi:ribose 5-phosphate isomerase B|nr:ribose 5-phosphate isomerase B [Caldisericota bacterium]